MATTDRCSSLRRFTLILLASAAASLVGCAGTFPIVAVQRGTPVSNVRVVPGPELQQDRWQHLAGNGLVGEMESALRGSFPAGPGPEVVVNVVEFVAPQISGRAWIVVRVDTMGPQGPLAQPIVLRSESAGEPSFWTGQMGARDDAVRRVCADIVQQTASAFP